MTFTVYLSKRTIFTSGHALPAGHRVTWDEWSFTPAPRRRWRRAGSTFLNEVSDPVPVAIVAPPLAKIVERPAGQRLSFHGEEYGIDAASAASLAFGRRRGFRVAAKEEAST